MNAPQLPPSPMLARQDLEPVDDEIDLSRWLDALRRHRRLLLVITLATLATAVLMYAVTPRQYRATTVIQIERPAAALSLEELFGGGSYYFADAQSFYPTQYRLLKSRGLAERVVKSLRLVDDPVFNPARASMTGDGGEAEEANAAGDLADMGGLASRLLGGIEVNPVRDTRLVEISYVSTDPELATRIANGVADAYIDWGIETRTESVGRASSFLASQIEELKREIADKEAQLQAYGRRSDIVALDPNSNVVVQRLEALNRDYTDAMSKRISAEAEYNEVMQAPAETVADTFSGGLVAQLRRELLDLEQEYATKLNTYKPEWPAMVELQSKIEKGRQHVQSVIAEMVEQARDSARTTYQTSRRREQSLAEELTRQKNQAMLLNSAAVEYNNLLVEVSTRRNLLDELVRKLSETGVADRLQGTRTSNILIVDRALVPGGPYRPSLPRNLALGLVLGLMLGGGLVVLIELLDRTVRTPDDLERLVSLPVLGVVPDLGGEDEGGYGYGYGYGAGAGTSGLGAPGSARRRRAGNPLSLLRRAVGRAASRVRSGPAAEVAIELLPQRHPRMAATEAYRTIRTAILLSTAGGLRSVVVTSAVPGEGKTATATNLAVVMAQLGRRVLLIDADLRRPRLHEIFEVSNRTGLVSYLAGTADPEAICLRTPIENLFLTPSGPTPPNPAELLASSCMAELAELAGSQFDFVVYDSPPVVAVTDSTIIGALADGVLLCVGAGRVKREDVTAAISRLGMGEVRLLGLVLNRFIPDVDAFGARYRRYAAYAHGYTTEAPDAAEAPPKTRRPGANAAL